jgi:hypothetical protein
MNNVEKWNKETTGLVIEANIENFVMIRVCTHAGQSQQRDPTPPPHPPSLPRPLFWERGLF